MPKPAFLQSASAVRLNSVVARKQCSALDARRVSLPRCAAPRMLSTSTIGNKSYQLEEMEDAASATSAIYLHGNGTVAYGRTDGPVPKKVDGTWIYNEDLQELCVELERHFDDGRVQFSIRRTLRGHLDCPDETETAVFAGNIFREPSDFDDPKSALGHWTMIAADGLPLEEFSNAEESN